MSFKEIDELLYDLENELIEHMFLNLKKYTPNEEFKNINKANWRAKALAGVEQYKKESKIIINKYQKEINSKLVILYKETYNKKLSGEEKKVLEHIVKGNNTKNSIFKKLLSKLDGKTQQEQAKTALETNFHFLKVNTKKIDKLITMYEKDINNKAFKNLTQFTTKEYKKILLKSELGANMGFMTTNEAIDNAAGEFLSRGINNVVYKNGANVNIKSYCEMAIRTNNKELQRQADADFRKEIGEELVQMTSIGNCCSNCQAWQGKIMIDDVYNDGKGTKYPKLSECIDDGCFHPNCRHDLINYYSFVEQPKDYSKKQVEENYEKEQEQRYNERKIREWKRKKEYYLDEKDRIKAEEKVKYWQNRQKELIKNNEDILRRNYWREKIN